MAQEIGPISYQGSYAWTYKAYKQEGMGSLRLLIEGERFAAEVRVAGMLQATIEGTVSNGFHLRKESGEPPQFFNKLSEIPLLIRLPIDRPHDLIPLLEGQSPLLQVQERDTKGPLKYYCESRDSQGRMVKLWLTRK